MLFPIGSFGSLKRAYTLSLVYQIERYSRNPSTHIKSTTGEEDKASKRSIAMAYESSSVISSDYPDVVSLCTFNFALFLRAFHNLTVILSSRLHCTRIHYREQNNNEQSKLHFRNFRKTRGNYLLREI